MLPVLPNLDSNVSINDQKNECVFGYTESKNVSLGVLSGVTRIAETGEQIGKV